MPRSACLRAPRFRSSAYIGLISGWAERFPLCCQVYAPVRPHALPCVRDLRGAVQRRLVQGAATVGATVAAAVAAAVATHAAAANAAAVAAAAVAQPTATLAAAALAAAALAAAALVAAALTLAASAATSAVHQGSFAATCAARRQRDA